MYWFIGMKKTIRYSFQVVFILLTLNVLAQTPKRYNSSEIYKKIEKLNILGNALYIAAHPDDENTRLITYLSNAVMVNTAYLSLTRGDGGQNSIGPEQSEFPDGGNVTDAEGSQSHHGGEGGQ